MSHGIRCFAMSLLLVFVVLSPRLVWAFDTGHHSDLCYSALSDLQFDKETIYVVQVQNWLTDYYSASKWNSPSLAAFQNLHFDNLFTYTDIRNYWGQLAINTKSAVQDAATNNDQLKFLTVLGISLHAVQDFYTHSNWVELHTKPAGNNFNGNTWLSSPIAASAPIQTGWYPSKLYPTLPTGATPHGNYSSGMNHDSYVRPRWDEAYVYAYVASWEWASNCLDWAHQANPNFDGRNISQQIATSTEKTLYKDQSAAYRISEWIVHKDDNGHWKGNGSGSSHDCETFLFYWMSDTNSALVNAFKKNNYEKLISANLYSSTPPDPQLIPVFTPYSLARSNVLFLQTTNVAGTGEDKVYALTKIQSSAANPARTDPAHTYIDAALYLNTQTQQWAVPHFYRPNDLIRVDYQLWKEVAAENYNFAPGTKDTMYTLSGGKHNDLQFSINSATNTSTGDFSGNVPFKAAFVPAPNTSNTANVTLQVTPCAIQYTPAGVTASNPWSAQ